MGFRMAMSPKWALSVAGKFFERLDRPLILSRVTRTGADVREAERLQQLADRAFMIGDPEALADHPLQVDPAPAHDPVYGPVRTRLDEFREFGPLLRREARLGSLGPAVQKTVRTVCVEPMHPVPQRLPRGHLTEFGVIAAKGPAHTSKLIAALEDPASDLPQAARGILAVLVEELRSLDERAAVLDREIARHARENAVALRVMPIPGIGVTAAVALTALAPPAQTFRCGRDFAAWLGLTPVQRSSGGKERLGKNSKMGERSLRRLLIIGASAVARWAARKGVPAGSWLGRMLARKPKMLVRVALANKMARIVWALLGKGGGYRAPVAAV